MSRSLRVLTLAAITAGLVGISVPALADPVYVSQSIALYDGIGSMPGGEFNADLNADGSIDFLTFCVQHDEYFYLGQTMYIGGIGNTIQAGGQPLASQTAYLYSGFRDLSLSYTYAASGTSVVDGASYTRTQTATALQQAIWFLQGQISSVSNQLALYYVGLADQAVSSGAWVGLGDVRVLNLYAAYDPSTGLFSGNRQDQLALVDKVPEPGTLVLLLVGCGLATVITRRRQARLGPTIAG